MGLTKGQKLALNRSAVILTDKFVELDDIFDDVREKAVDVVDPNSTYAMEDLNDAMVYLLKQIFRRY